MNEYLQGHIHLHLKTVSESNTREHWSQAHKRHQRQQTFVNLALQSYVHSVSFPCRVVLTRLSPRLLDDDNLVGAFKWIRDAVGAYLFPEKIVTYKGKNGLIEMKGHADSDPRVKWEYAQETAKRQAICIDIYKINDVQTGGRIYFLG